MDIINDTLDTSDEKQVDVEILTSCGKTLVTGQPLSMLEEEASLSPDGSETLTQGLLENGDEEITYQLRAGDVTYRVVSVNPDDLSNGLQQMVNSNGTTFNPSQNEGQLYLISSQQEVFDQQNQRNIVPRVSQNVHIENSRGSTSSPHSRPRDDRRRATHNEVERRRRDKINNWIMKLSKIIPECSQESGKGSFETQSKGGILAKACDYIMELRTGNQRLTNLAKDNVQLTAEIENMARQLQELQRENEILRTQLVENGIQPQVKHIT